MKWIKVTISIITFIAITSIGEAFSSDFDSYSKSKIEDQKLEEKIKEEDKSKDEKEKQKEVETNQNDVSSNSVDSADESVQQEVTVNKSSVNSSSEVSSSSQPVPSSPTSPHSNSTSSSPPISQPSPNTTASTPSVDCSLPLFNDDYIDFTNYNDVINFKNRVNTEVGGKISWREVIGKCGTSLGYRVQVYVGGITYSKNEYENYF